MSAPESTTTFAGTFPGTFAIAVIGGESTGKSTVAAQLATALGAVCVPEVLRGFVTEHGRMPRADEQRIIFDAQAVTPAQDPVILDPAPLQTALYSLAYFADDSLLAPGLAHAAQIDAVLWCRTDIPWVREPGMRDSPAARDLIDRLIAEQIAPILPMIEVSGPLRDPQLLITAAKAALQAR